MTVEKIKVRKERKWKVHEEMSRKLYKNLVLEDYFERPFKTLSLVIH